LSLSLYIAQDEYVGLARDHPQSYHRYMWDNFFQHVDVNPSNVNILDGCAADLQEECDKYEAKIAKYGGIELFLGGIGPDGHIAFNEPGSSLSSRTRVKTLAFDTIKANSRFFGGDESAVPKMALTVGVGTVVDAREVVVIITGAHKANALAKCIEEGVSHMWTVSALQLHQRAMIVCDDDATLELRVKTVRYFKGACRTRGAGGRGRRVRAHASERASEQRGEARPLLHDSGQGFAFAPPSDPLLVSPAARRPYGDSGGAFETGAGLRGPRRERRRPRAGRQRRRRSLGRRARRS